MRLNKYLLTGLFSIGIGAFVSYYSGKLASSIPENVIKYNQLSKRINEIYDTDISVDELLSPEFRNSLESELYAFQSERDSLKSLPNFEENNKRYKKSEWGFTLSLMSYLFGIYSFTYGAGIGIERKKQKKSKFLN